MLVTDDFAPGRMVVRIHGESIHGGRGEGWVILWRDQVIGEDSATRFGKGNGLWGELGDVPVDDGAGLGGRSHTVEFAEIEAGSHGHLSGDWHDATSEAYPGRSG
jgi:hypothetical protein